MAAAPPPPLLGYSQSGAELKDMAVIGAVKEEGSRKEKKVAVVSCFICLDPVVTASEERYTR